MSANHARNPFRHARFVLACTVGLAALAAAPAWAADGQPQAQKPKEIVVTGSRVGRSTFTSATPITVINTKDIEKLDLTNVGNIVAQMPQQSSFVSSANVGLGNFNIGDNLANLRGLNPFFGTRTLTLVDTQRLVPTTNGGAVDLNIIPTPLVERVETVTGGASAAYGSDAIAGVVNVILNTQFQGFKGQADYGQTGYGDGEDYHVSFAAGTGFDKDRGHVVFAFEYEKQNSIGNCARVRSWCATNYGQFTNTNYTSYDASGQPIPGTLGDPTQPGYRMPHYIIGPNARSLSDSTGVFLPSPFTPTALINKRFNAAGNGLVDFNGGNYTAGAVGLVPSQGGDDYQNQGWYDWTPLRPEVQHYSMWLHAEHDLFDGVKGSIDASYSKKDANNVQGSTGALGFPIDGIYSDNAYLPASVATQFPLAPYPYDVVPFTRSSNDLVPQVNDTSVAVWRVGADLKGDLPWGNWSWEGNYAYGRNTSHERLHNDIVNDFSYPIENIFGKQPNPVGYDFFSWALDAVKNSSGNIVCRATIPTSPAYDPRAAGCAPLDLFGSGHASQAALNYVYRTLHQDTTETLQTVSATAHGDLFQGWAGPIGGAVGIDFRDDQIDVTHDLAQQPWYFNYFLSYGKDYSADRQTTEGFAEVNAPLVTDKPFFKALSVDGAFRESYSDQSGTSSGLAPIPTVSNSASDTFSTWKISLDWSLDDWFRVRASRSRDVRSPSFFELYSQNVASGGIFGSVTNDWHPGPPQPATVTRGGNPNGLKPEKADTWTAGLVFTGQNWLEGFQASADWYQIVIHGAISELSFITAQGIVNACYYQHQFCQYITGVPDGSGGYSQIQTIQNYNFNIGSYTTRGVDFEAQYNLPLDRFNGSWGGNLNFRVLASYLYNMIVNPGAGLPVYDYAGQTGPAGAFGNFNSSPDWQANAFITYSKGPFSTTLQLRYIGPGKYAVVDANTDKPMIAPSNAGYSTTLPNSINNNSVDSAVYVNLAAQYDINKRVQVFGKINNLFDVAPPIAPGGNGFPTNPVYFDTFGLTWKMGVRIHF